MLTDKKSGQKILRPIFNPAHHVVSLCLDFLAVRRDFDRKCCGGKLGWLVLVNSSPKLIFDTSRYSRVPSQLTFCARRSTSRYSVTTNLLCAQDVLPPTTTTTRDSLISIKGHIFKQCALLCLSSSA